MSGQDEELEDEKEGGGAMSPERALSAVRKRLKLVVALPIVLGALTAAIVINVPNRYDASAFVQIDPRQKLVSNLDNVVTDLKGDFPTIESEVEVIRSRPIILSVIDTLGLRSDPEFSRKSTLSGLKAMLGISAKSEPPTVERRANVIRDQIAEILNPESPGSSTPERDEVAAAFAERLRIVRVRTTLLIDIRFSASDAVKAAKIANTVAETYIRQQIETKRRANAAASEILESKIEELRGKVSEAERKVEQWKARNNIFDSEGFILSEKQMARLMEQTVNARNTTAEAHAKYEQAQKLARAGDGGTALAEVLKSPTVQTLKDQRAQATRKAAELATKYGPKHPEILKSKADVAQADVQLAEEIERLVSNLKNEYEVAEGRERQLAQNLTQMKDQQANTKDAGIDLKDLEREAATSKQMFEALLTRYKQTSGTQDFQLPDAHIVEKADTPLYPASPKRKQLVVMAAVGGFVMSIALAILLELMAPGIIRNEDVERTLKVAHLASVPAMHSEDDRSGLRKAVRLIVAEPSSTYADAIRNARRELDMRRTVPLPRIILVTSSMAGEGAEVIASNLAHHYAMTGGRPLLIDGDARLQLLTRQLASQRPCGLFDQILNAQPAENAILRDGLTGLHFLPAAAASANLGSIPETLSSQAMTDALTGLKSRFDTIILSAPPLLPVMDGRILADSADQIVFVMTWQKTPKQLAKKALTTLGTNSRKVAGVVLNDVSEEAFNEARGFSQTLQAATSRGFRRTGPRQAA